MLRTQNTISISLHAAANEKYLNAFLHGDQVAALFVMLVTYLAFLVME